MSNMEKEELVDRVKAMSLEEKQLVLKALPQELILGELLRRDKVKTEMIEKMRSVLHVEVQE